MRVSHGLHVSVVDSESNRPIPQADVVYINYESLTRDWNRAIYFHEKTDTLGRINIKSKWVWGLWLVIPDGLPSNVHYIAIWAQGYGAYLYSEIDSINGLRKDPYVPMEIRKTLEEIPEDTSSTDEALNPRDKIFDGPIKLHRNK
ncbi:MAG: hypothetical protein ACYDBV_01855 [Nitrospiria bacterium]